jgi:hypothetical protein
MTPFLPARGVWQESFSVPPSPVHSSQAPRPGAEAGRGPSPGGNPAPHGEGRARGPAPAPTRSLPRPYQTEP